jgi:DNA invertase Pin-like site-specific DNA recombinase
VRAAIYARVSTGNGQQTVENQLVELRRYVQARGWEPVEYVDEGVSGTRESRPALDRLVADVRRRKVDVVVCWALDRLGRSLRHLITLLDDFQALGVAFISLRESIDCTTPAGKLQLQILGALAEFERSRISDRVRAGLARAKAQGIRLGRPRVRIAGHKLAAVQGLTVSEAAQRLGVSRSTAHRMMVRSLKAQEGSPA